MYKLSIKPFKNKQSQINCYYLNLLWGSYNIPNKFTRQTFTVIYQCKKWILFSNKKFTLRALWKSNRRKVFRDVIKLYLWVIQRPFQGCSSNKASFSAPIPWVLLQGSLSFGSYVVLYTYYYYLAQIRAYIHIKRCYPLI